MANEVIYANAADARVTVTTSNFATARAATTGTLQSASTNPTGMGDNFSAPNYTINRFFMYFASSASAGTVDSATFSFECQSVTGGNSKTLHIVESSASTTVVADDYNNIAFPSFGSVLVASAGVKSITVNSAGLAYLSANLGNNIKLALIGKEDQEDDSTGITDFGISVYTGDEATQQKPKLDMTYTERTAGGPAILMSMI